MNKDILKKVQQIDIRLRRKVNTVFAGSYRSAFKGQGMVFSDFREYVPGDDVRSISWNLTARMSAPYIKTFEEDREAQILLVLDVSSSMDFGTGEHSKRSALDMLSSVLAFCSQKNKDRLGLLLFSDKIELYIPPRKGYKYMLRIVREIHHYQRKSVQTDIAQSFSFLYKVLKIRSHIFVFSDFLNSSFEKPMRLLSKKHDVVNLVFSDLLEREMPPLGLVDIEDIETGEQKTVDLSSFVFQKDFKKAMRERIEKRKKQFAKSQSHQIFIDCQKDIYEPLIHFFQKQGKAKFS